MEEKRSALKQSQEKKLVLIIRYSREPVLYLLYGNVQRTPAYLPNVRAYLSWMSSLRHCNSGRYATHHCDIPRITITQSGDPSCDGGYQRSFYFGAPPFLQWWCETMAWRLRGRQVSLHVMQCSTRCQSEATLETTSRVGLRLQGSRRAAFRHLVKAGCC